MTTLFDKIGGSAAVAAAVPLFYQKVLTDDRLSHFFTGMDIERIESHQKAFLTYAFGGPNNYSGRSLRGAHQSLAEKYGLTNTHFDAVIGHLAATLAELNVPSELIAEAGAIAESTRADVLNEPAS